MCIRDSYSYYQDTRTNSGLGGSPFVLPSQAYNTNEVENRIQISDSQVYGTKLVNNTRFQYVRDQDDQTPQFVAPSINVLQNFEGGGSPQGTGHDTETRYEFQNYASLSLTRHYLRFGGRLRNIHDTNYSNANFEGTYTYSNLPAYLANTPSQFSITTGTPTQSASVTDLGLYAEDDWKVRPNFTLSYGPVSYTHLDVYKRQVRRSSIGVGLDGLHLALLIEVVPVGVEQ